MAELVGHVQKEQKIGTMHQTRMDLDVLSGREGFSSQLFGTEAPWPYFSLVSRFGLEAVDRVIDEFIVRDHREIAFWRKFHNKVHASGASLPFIAETFSDRMRSQYESLYSLAGGLKRSGADQDHIEDKSAHRSFSHFERSLGAGDNRFYIERVDPSFRRWQEEDQYG